MAQNHASNVEKSKMLRRRIGITTQVLMQLRGISATELTKRSTWDLQSKTSRLLNGHASWRENELAEVAKILGVPVGVLFETPREALEFLGLPADVAQAFLDNTLTPEQVALTSRYADSWRDLRLLRVS